jgi:hypothetical protein
MLPALAAPDSRTKIKSLLHTFPPQAGNQVWCFHFTLCALLYALSDFLNREGFMGEVVHTSRIKIVREKGPTRRAMIEGFSEPVFYGVHGGIKKFYKVEPEKEHAATLDHIVAATAG